jgi:hypothetical protein
MRQTGRRPAARRSNAPFRPRRREAGTAALLACMQNKGVNTFHFSLQASSPHLLLHCNTNFCGGCRQWLGLAFYLTFKASRLFYSQLPEPGRCIQSEVLAAFRRCSD